MPPVQSKRFDDFSKLHYMGEVKTGKRKWQRHQPRNTGAGQQYAMSPFVPAYPLVPYRMCFRALGQFHRQLGIGCLRSEEHTSELQSLMRISYAVFCLPKKTYHLSITLLTPVSA